MLSNSVTSRKRAIVKEVGDGWRVAVGGAGPGLELPGEIALTAAAVGFWPDDLVPPAEPEPHAATVRTLSVRLVWDRPRDARRLIAEDPPGRITESS
jgi:hypothetical protein